MWILYCQFCYRAQYQPLEQLLPALSQARIHLQARTRMDPLIDWERERTMKVIFSL
jgi:endonuclease I